MDLQAFLITTYVVIGVSIIVGFAFYFFYVKKFNKKVSILIQGNGVTKKVHDTAMFYVDNSNIGWWKLRKFKDELALPPKECIYFDAKGNECCDFVKKGDLDYRALTFIDREDEKKVGFTPISQQSRIVYGYQFKKSIMLKNNTMAAMIEKYAPYLMLIVVAVLAIVVYDGIGKKVVEIANVQAAITQDMDSMAKALVEAQLIVNQNWRNQSVVPTQRPLQG
jgi:hypothetical protein